MGDMPERVWCFDDLLAGIIGQPTYPDSYDDDERVECSHGIHVFMTRQEAEEW